MAGYSTAGQARAMNSVAFHEEVNKGWRVTQQLGFFAAHGRI